MTDARGRTSNPDWPQLPVGCVWEDTVSVTDYVIDILLILVIFRQGRPHELARVGILQVRRIRAAGHTATSAQLS